MKRLLPVLMALGFLGVATRAPAACRWFGTQLDCHLGGRQVLIGTQTAADPADVAGVRPQSFSGGGLLGGRAVPDWPLRIEIQNVGTDPALCRKWGNETYCY